MKSTNAPGESRRAERSSPSTEGRSLRRGVVARPEFSRRSIGKSKFPHLPKYVDLLRCRFTVSFSDSPHRFQEMIPETPENASDPRGFGGGLSRTTTAKKREKLADFENSKRDECDMEAFVENEIERKLAKRKKNTDRLFDAAFERSKGGARDVVDNREANEPKIETASKETPKKRRRIKPKKIKVPEFVVRSDVLPNLVVEKVQRSAVYDANPDFDVRKISLDSIFTQNTQSKSRETIQNVVSSVPTLETDGGKNSKNKYEERVSDRSNEIGSLSPISINENDKIKLPSARSVLSK